MLPLLGYKLKLKLYVSTQRIIATQWIKCYALEFQHRIKFNKLRETRHWIFGKKTHTRLLILCKIVLPHDHFLQIWKILEIFRLVKVEWFKTKNLGIDLLKSLWMYSMLLFSRFFQQILSINTSLEQNLYLVGLW